MTPEELRKLTATGQNEARAKARTAKKKACEEREARIQVLRSRLPDWKSQVEHEMKQAAKQGSSKARVYIITKKLDDRQIDHDMIRPIVDELAKGFEAFNAKVRVEFGMTWYSDGAGPGDDDYYIDLSW